MKKSHVKSSSSSISSRAYASCPHLKHFVRWTNLLPCYRLSTILCTWHPLRKIQSRKCSVFLVFFLLSSCFLLPVFLLLTPFLLVLFSGIIFTLLSTWTLFFFFVIFFLYISISYSFYFWLRSNGLSCKSSTNVGWYICRAFALCRCRYRNVDDRFNNDATVEEDETVAISWVCVILLDGVVGIIRGEVKLKEWALGDSRFWFDLLAVFTEDSIADGWNSVFSHNEISKDLLKVFTCLEDRIVDSCFLLSWL